MRQGLYDPQFEHDACGVGFVAHIKGQASHDIVRDALAVLDRMRHRGAAGADPETGDGAGILIQLPVDFLTAEGVDPQAAVCTGTTLLERVSQEDLLASGLAEFGDEAVQPVIEAALDCGVAQEDIDATLATARGE